MATTTNYGWTTPDDTALVKDGASAIRTLGSSVDTTTKNLNPETTLGDIAYRSSTANVNTRLPLGTAGQVLVVNSGATAPEWATPASSVPTLNEQAFTASGTFTPPTGVTKVYVEILSGGGSGAKDANYTGGGGGAGGRINKLFTVTPGSGVTVTIGAGGATKSTNGAGNAGSASSFDGTSATAGTGGKENGSANIDALTMGQSSWDIGGVNGGAAAANSGAGGGGNNFSNGGAGGSGRIIVRWLS